MCSRLRRYAVEALFTRSEHDRCMGVILSIDTLKFVRSHGALLSCCPTMLESTANVGLFETAEGEMLYGTVDLNSVSSSSAKLKTISAVPEWELPFPSSSWSWKNTSLCEVWDSPLPAHPRSKTQAVSQLRRAPASTARISQARPDPCGHEKI